MTYRCVIFVASEVAGDTKAKGQAQALRQRHGWPLVRNMPNRAEADVCLIRNLRGWSALWLAASNWKPLYFDYTHPGFLRRLAHAGSRSETLIKALGRRRPGTVLDCTAGAGEDSLILAACGARVHMVERDPILATLLSDALARGRDAQLPELSAVLERVTFSCADAGDLITQLRVTPEQSQAEIGSFEVVYCDPMFPARDKSALVSKTMQFFHCLVGVPEEGSDDAEALVRSALAVATRRVVVKRPAKARHVFESPAPHQHVQNKAVRFDIYLTGSTSAC